MREKKGAHFSVVVDGADDLPQNGVQSVITNPEAPADVEVAGPSQDLQGHGKPAARPQRFSSSANP